VCLCPRGAVGEGRQPVFLCNKKYCTQSKLRGDPRALLQSWMLWLGELCAVHSWLWPEPKQWAEYMSSNDIIYINRVFTYIYIYIHTYRYIRYEVHLYTNAETGTRPNYIRHLFLVLVEFEVFMDNYWPFFLW